MNKLFFIFLAGILLSVSCNKQKEDPKPKPIPTEIAFIRSCDLSFVPEIRESGVVCKNLSGQQEDMLLSLKNAGMNVVRLRLWNNPADGHSGMKEVKEFSDEIHNKGMKVWLTVHYSDTWADPGAQSKPVAWNNMPFNRLKDSLYVFTKRVMEHIQPDYIQIGNEINNGLLWPDGKMANLSQMTQLLSRGIAAVRETDTSTKIILHYAGFSGAEAFYTKMETLDYDMIGLSYYPIWHGKQLTELETALESLSAKFDKKLLIAETSYPFSFDWYDYTTNVIGSQDQILAAYPATAQGQKDFVLKIRDIIDQAPNGKGFSYWGGEFIAFKGNTATNGSSWENQALWDFEHKALPVMEAFGD
jgi:arabinogalactan endo-1,4-beta-galactosidase